MMSSCALPPFLMKAIGYLNGCPVYLNSAFNDILADLRAVLCAQTLNLFQLSFLTQLLRTSFDML